MIENLLDTALNTIKNIGLSIWNFIFSGIDFGVLWRWLPSDLQAAIQYIVVFLFILGLAKLIKAILPVF